MSQNNSAALRAGAVSLEGNVDVALRRALMQVRVLCLRRHSFTFEHRPWFRSVPVVSSLILVWLIPCLALHSLDLCSYTLLLRIYILCIIHTRVLR